MTRTGTVTEGRIALAEVVPSPGVDPERLLALAGAAEDASEHPIARAIAEAARARLGRLPAVDGFASHAGLGVESTVDGHAVLLGRPALLTERGMALSAELDLTRREQESKGRTAVAVAWDGRAQGLLVVADRVKPAAAEAVGALHELGLRTVLLTGDNEPSARAVATAIGIERVIAEVMPQDKADVIRGLQREGEVVAMVGDGVNDAPALALADLGLAIGTGTDVAIGASDITLVSGDPRAAADAIRLARRVLGTIRGNLFWAFAYNIAAIPLAAAGLLNPMIAAAAMAGSSLFVLSNSLRLRGFRSTREQPTGVQADSAPGSVATSQVRRLGLAETSGGVH